jgi:MFS family permease
MKRLAPWTLLLVTLLVIVVPFALAAATTAPAAPKGDRSPAAPIASAVSTITGIAISPLLGTGAYGAYQWATAKDAATREKLPWYAQVTFWLPALLIVAICAAKDGLGAAVPPGWKKPLDVLETVENKLSGLVAAGAVVPFAVSAMTKIFFESGGVAQAGAPVFVPSGVAAIHLAAVDFTWLLNLLTVPFGIAVFAVVWLASHAINVLILLSPWGAIDAGLKATRTALLGLVTLSATINPWVGAVLSVVVIVVAYLVAGWAFRLTVFGSVFCWDFFTRRRNRFTPQENDNAMFAGANCPGVPVRTYGRLVQRTEGGLEFVYRPWLLLPPKSAPIPVEPKSLAVGEGLLFSDIVTDEGQTLFSLPPRYRGHEEVVARAYLMGGGVRPAGLRKAWSALRDMLGGAAVKKGPLAA